MKITISTNGRLTIPQSVRKRHQFRSGEKLFVFELSDDEILLQRVRAPMKSIVWHMRRFQGLNIERNKETFGR